MVDEIPLGNPGQPAVALEPGIIHIPGAWNVNLIRQDDGIVVLEGPISSGYSVRVLAEAHKRFPDLPVKAVITTSDSWPHIGGLREYVARDIPIYALRVRALGSLDVPDHICRQPGRRKLGRRRHAYVSAVMISRCGGFKEGVGFLRPDVALLNGRSIPTPTFRMDLLPGAVLFWQPRSRSCSPRTCANGSGTFAHGSGRLSQRRWANR
ncbi:MAG: hypothetical protein ABI227_12125 [Rhodanobacter sp.]